MYPSLKKLDTHITIMFKVLGIYNFEKKADHAFDGMAMIRRYRVDKPSDVNQTSPDLSISRRLIQSDFLRDNLAAGGFTKYGSGTASMNTSILNRIKSLGGPGMVVSVVEFILWR